MDDGAEDTAPRHAFAHERLDAYRLAREVAVYVSATRWPPTAQVLRDQALRAAQSMVLNLAEGAGRGPGDARRNHFRTALGSAAELCAVLDLVALPDRERTQARLRRVGAMLHSLAR